MAITERYVRSDAAGGGNGTTDTNSGANGAFTWAEMITDINTPRVGYRYNVKAGTYSLGATTTITGDGDATSPNIIRGFNSTIGDLVAIRASGGALSTTNVPVIAYSSTFRLTASTGTNLIIESLSFTGNVSNALVEIGGDSLIQNCIVNNSSSNAAAIGIKSASGLAQHINCDVIMNSAVSGAAGIDSLGLIYGNRVTVASGTGIVVRNNLSPVAGNLVYESGIGISKTITTTRCYIFDNTIVNCSGDGIDIITSTTAICYIVGNHITGCGGYGIDFNTSTCPKFLVNNRFRDNTSGNINGGGDYETATNTLNITSADSDSTDFTDSTNDDYSLKTGAAAARKGLSYLRNIGGNGTPAGSSGGGSFTFS